ncbi:SDR family oxidoreductase [Aciduricibacillus chroicocephali]|uniref:SDR family oxidoreductase n=1 Tax=Aciduricibacillus chroicocephali TaxID=3054939 RepID=A0ABY9KS21_9BACI|nr:SDR family oxidoreductase [Bacillaceae bacterium 44XB]
MNKSITGKKIIITGASGGLGAQFAMEIAKAGGIPILIARSLDKLEAVRRQIAETTGIEAFVYSADLLDEAALSGTFETILEKHERIDALINNAGVGKFDAVLDMDWSDLDRMFRLNVFAMIRTIQYMLPHFRKNSSGHIVNIISQAGKIATPKSAGYCASKHAMIGYSNVLRQEAREMGVQVTTVNVGPVRTDFFDKADPEGSYAKSVERYMLNPADVAVKVAGLLFTSRRELNMPWWMEFGSKMYQLIPGLMEKVLKSQFNKK